MAHPFSRTEADSVGRPPRLRARFFYNSNIAIDDPLAPVPPPAAGSAASKQAPRPFTPEDNAALDKAWNDLQVKIRRARQDQAAEATALGARRVQEWGQRQLEAQHSRPSSRKGESLSRSARASIDIRPDRSRGGSVSSQHRDTPTDGQQPGQSPQRSAQRRPYWDSEPMDGTNTPNSEDAPASHDGARSDLDGTNEGTTGTPFIRAPARPRSELNRYSPRPSPRMAPVQEASDPVPPTDIAGSSTTLQTELKPFRDAATARVPVGEARLHHVTFPALEMEPTYWSPVNDIAPVTRGTWFYKESMLPVEVDVANLLEAGYLSLRPWTVTWRDELNSAVEVGAAGEEKIAHLLWPEPAKLIPETRPGTSMGSVTVDHEEEPKEKKQADVLAHAISIIDEAFKEAEHDNKSAGTNEYGRDSQKRSFPNSSVIYADEKYAYILRPNLQPSSYYGRRPYANYIRKQHQIGIAVVRGFDQFAWDILHPSKGAQFLKQPALNAQQSRPSMARPQRPSTRALLNTVRPRTTDLVLVIHGIGQKLSERMESYHFTHAMNAFRREMNVELEEHGIKRHLRNDAGGIMVLPVNWRSTLSFEEGGYRDGPDDPSRNNYSLKDITPESLPSVRNIISDVMLDIPYYLSHHQPKMISAVLKEANRIYRLWCQNNPGFEKYGRVHIIAHSLGSVMALDILSKQPTHLNDVSATPDDPADPKYFAFDTTNLYLCGSPAGFFLLLKRAGLTPRRGRAKPSADGDEAMPGVAGELGEYGCIAVDNVYNIINPYDPVAYRLNACVDAAYSALLKPAIVPSVRSPWYSFSAGKSTYGSAMGSAAPGRPGAGQRLPSSVELDTHNFSREEIAEKRAYLLNDNGQVDFFLRYGGGPLEIQYLTMLGAHSSYWLSRDFIRFLVMETGRKPGRDSALQGLRAIKKIGYATRGGAS